MASTPPGSPSPPTARGQPARRSFSLYPDSARAPSAGRPRARSTSRTSTAFGGNHTYSPRCARRGAARGSNPSLRRMRPSTDVFPVSQVERNWPSAESMRDSCPHHPHPPWDPRYHAGNGTPAAHPSIPPSGRARPARLTTSDGPICAMLRSPLLAGRLSEILRPRQGSWALSSSTRRDLHGDVRLVVCGGP